MAPRRAPPPSTALDGLDQIDWANLDHAYGKAADTPVHLRRLRSPHAKLRRPALRALAHSVYHQSGGYSASAPALRCLLRLLAEPDAPLAAQTLDLVCDLGVVVGVHWTLTGYQAPRPWLQQWHGADDSTGLDHFLECYAIFAAAAPLYQELLQRQGAAALRVQAAYALAFIPAARATSLPLLEARVERDRDAAARASALLAIAALSRSGDDDERADLRAWLAALPPPPPDGVLAAVRAIAPAYLEDGALDDAQLAALGRAATEGAYLAGFPWWGGTVGELALRWLVERGEREAGDEREAIAALLLERFRGYRGDDDDRAAALGGAALQLALGRSPEPRDLAALTTPRREVIAALLLRPAVFHRPDRSLEHTLRAAGVPESPRDLAAALGWLPADADDGAVDPRPAIARHHPLDAGLLARVGDHLDWRVISTNPHLVLDDATIERFAARWDWHALTGNPALRWDEARLARFAARLDWAALSYRADVPWTDALIDREAERLDWHGLSSNRGLPWSEALIARHRDRFTWHVLSQNPALPWTEALLRRYRRWYWEYLSGNDGLPWSPAFLARHRRKIDGCQFCRVERFPWTEAFLEAEAGWLACWGTLSGNPGLPWSEALIARHVDRWNWYVLSANRALPWSEALLRAHEARWSWRDLARNPAITWTPAMAELRDRHVDAGPSDDDRGVYDALIGPHLDADGVVAVVEHAAARRRAAEDRRVAHVLAHAPGIDADHPLVALLRAV